MVTNHTLVWFVAWFCVGDDDRKAWISLCLETLGEYWRMTLKQAPNQESFSTGGLVNVWKKQDELFQICDWEPVALWFSD